MDMKRVETYVDHVNAASIISCEIQDHKLGKATYLRVEGLPDKPDLDNSFALRPEWYKVEVICQASHVDQVVEILRDAFTPKEKEIMISSVEQIIKVAARPINHPAASGARSVITAEC